jgi:c-di-GMP-binding flagellar brake protein YcgR
VTVAILKQHQPFAYGVIRNISEGGACLLTDADSLSGRFLVRVSFYNDEVVEVEARAAWSGGREQIDGRYGVEFLSVSQRTTEKLKRILVAPAYLPMGASIASRNGYYHSIWSQP